MNDLERPTTSCPLTNNEVTKMINKSGTAVALALAISTIWIPAVPAAAAPNPNPAAPAHTGTACANVLAKNPQAGPGSHSAPPAQENFSEVGAVFCGTS